jgi:TadE-like protein
MMRKRHERNARGQTLVEMALVLPIFLLILIAVFDLGHVVWANDALANAAREATRYAIVHGGVKSNLCPVGPPAPDAVIPPQSSSCPNPSPSKQSIRDAATNFAGIAGTNVTVYVCYWLVSDSMPNVEACDNASSDDTADTDLTSGRDNSRGHKVTVVVKANVGLVAPAFFGFQSISLQATSTMLVNH